MSTALKEVFMSLGIDADAAIKALAELDKKTNDAVDSLEDIDKGAANAEDSIGSFGDRVKRVGNYIEENKSSMREFGSKLADGAKIAALAISGVVTGVGIFFDRWTHGTQEIERSAKTYGLSTSAFQELSFAAEKLGGDSETVSEVFKEMSLRLTEVAVTGSGPAKDALTVLKLNVKDLKNLKPEDQFNLLADALSGVADESKKFFLKEALFGEQGAIKIGNVLDKGSKGIAALRGEAVALGVVLDSDTIKSAKEFQTTIFTIKKTAEGLANAVAVRLLPYSKEIADRFLEWASANREIIATRLEDILTKLVDAAIKLGPSLVSIVDTIIRMSDAVGGVDKAIYAAAGTWAIFQSAGLASLGAVGAALAVLTAGLVAAVALGDQLSKGKREESARLAKAGDEIQEQIKTRNVIIDAAKSGDIDASDMRVVNALASTLPDLSVASNDSAIKSSKAIRKSIEDFVKAANPLTIIDEGRKLGEIPKKGKPSTDITAKTLLLERQKRAKENLQLHQAIDDLDRARFGSEGAGRALIEEAKAEALSRLSQTGDLSINQLIAEAVGQDTGFGGAQLKPAGLGTTVNHIDASLTFNIGGLEVTTSLTGSMQNDVVAQGEAIGQSTVETLRTWINAAFLAQRGQIIG